MLIGILPTVTHGSHGSGQYLRQPPLPPAQHPDPRRARRRHRHRHPRSGAATGADRVDPAGGGEHERPVPPPGRARHVRELLERRPGDRRCRGGDRRQLSISLRPTPLGGDAGATVRAGDGHAAGGAEEPGRAVASVVRGAVDHVDLRPVRGERALLPGAAADLRGGGSRRGTRRRWGAAAGRATPAQRNGVPLEPAGLRHPGRPAAPAGGEPGAPRGAYGRRHAGQRCVLLRTDAVTGVG